MFTAWFQQQEEFNSTIEEKTSRQLYKCLQKIYLSARGRDGTFYNKKTRLPLFGLASHGVRIFLSELLSAYCHKVKQLVWYTLYTKTVIHLSVGESGGYLPPLPGE